MSMSNVVDELRSIEMDMDWRSFKLYQRIESVVSASAEGLRDHTLCQRADERYVVNYVEDLFLYNDIRRLDGPYEVVPRRRIGRLRGGVGIVGNQP